MPVYDVVLGSHLDTLTVAESDRERARIQFAIADDNSSDRSASDRQRELDALRQISGVKAEFAVEAEGEGEARYLYLIENGELRVLSMLDSRASDRVEPPRGEYSPTVHNRASFSIDDLLEVLWQADVEGEEIDDDEIALPFLWPSRDQMLGALAKAAPMWREKSVNMLAEIDRQRYDIEISRGEVTCCALYTLAEDRNVAAAARFLELAGLAPTISEEVVTVPLVKPPRPKPPPTFDPEKPFTTGSAHQRETAWNQQTEYGHRRVANVSQMVAAVRDPANADRRYAAFRRSLYHYLAKRDTPEVHQLFLWALHEETDDVARTVTYVGWRLQSLIAKLPELIREAESGGDTRTALRMKRLLAEAV